jgi:uncharacterized membrane protein
MENIGMIILLLIIIAAVVGIITGIYSKVQDTFVEPVRKAKLDNKMYIPVKVSHHSGQTEPPDK